MPRLTGFAFMLALAGLAGCSTTLVQQLPAGNVTTCDPAWPGLWMARMDDSGKPERAWLEVSADCKQLTFTDSAKTSVEQKTLTLVSSAAGEFLSITDADGKPECIGKDPRDCGFPIERFVREGGQVRLFAANHRAVHDAIAAGQLAGMTKLGSQDDTDTEPTTKKKAKPADVNPANQTYQNLITGSPEQIGQWFVEHPEYFDAKPWLVLDRQATDTRPKHAEVKK